MITHLWWRTWAFSGVQCMGALCHLHPVIVCRVDVIFCNDVLNISSTQIAMITKILILNAQNAACRWHSNGTALAQHWQTV